MRVLVIPPMDKPRVKHICDSLPGEYTTLEELQGLVGGYIEPCAPAELRARNIELLANEEGLFKQLVPNMNLFPFFYVGTLVAVGLDDDDFVSLNDEQCAYLKGWLAGLCI